MKTLFYMPPCAPKNDFGNGAWRYIELAGDIGPSGFPRQDANFSYCCCGKFCQTNVCALSVIASALLFLIRHIVGMRSHKQVFWIAAPAIVAGVAHIKSVRYFTIGQFPRYAVGKLKAWVPIDPAMSRFHARTKPRPAAILPSGSVNSAPELFFEGRKVKSTKPFPAAVVHYTEASYFSRPLAAVYRAYLVGAVVIAYLGLSHVEGPSRIGQRRRPVCRGRRFAFVAQNPTKLQRLSGVAS